MLEVKFLGRGGYGCVSSARILGTVAVEHGLYATAVPRFGAERRGAPVHADVRISSKVIRLKSFINQGDMTVVLNAGVFPPSVVISHTKPQGFLVVNGSISDDYKSLLEQREIMFLEGTKLAIENFNTPMANIILLGAVFKSLGLDNHKKILNGVQKNISILEANQINLMIKLGSARAHKVKSLNVLSLDRSV